MAADANSLNFTDQLLSPVRTSTSPLLVWHSVGGERVELSGRVFDNWVAKSANLLVEELDAGPGMVVALRLPAHWKSLALALAVLHTGAELLVPSPEGDGEAHHAGPVDIVAADDPMAASTEYPGAAVIGVALGMLDLAFRGPAPDGMLDYAAEVRAFGDYFLPEAVAGGEPALRDASGSWAYSELFGARNPGGTALLGAGAGLGSALREAIGLWASGAALVLLGEGVAPTDRLKGSERVERVLGT